MITIHKYELTLRDHPQPVEIPSRFIILTVMNQPKRAGDNSPWEDQLCVWVHVDTDAEMETRTFQVIGTGEKICKYSFGDTMNNMEHISSIQIPPYVWHIYVDLKGNGFGPGVSSWTVKESF